MHHFIFPSQDTWISSGSSTITGESFRDQNFGRDQILEIKKEFFNNSFDHQTRALVNFNGTEFTELSKSVATGKITNPKYYLRLYEAEGNAELTEEYTLLTQPLSQSWTEGTGKFGDNPKNTNGCSWENRNNTVSSNAVQWSTQQSVGNTFASGTLAINTGDYDNQELTIGGVDFIFVSGSPNVFDNNSAEIFVESGSGIIQSAGNLTQSFNNNQSTHNLPITMTQIPGTGGIILSGSSAGTQANLSFATSTTLFTIGGDSTKALEGGTDTTEAVSGNGPSVLSVSHSIQSFSNTSPDTEIDVTDMVNMWLQGQYSNYGMLIRFSGSQETDSETFGHLKFFSRNTHTIYSPRLEVRWNDSSFNSDATASLNQLDTTGTIDNFLYMRGMKESYKVGERVKFRVGARKRYIQKTFSTSVQTVSSSWFPSDSGSYAIKDVATDEFVVPFSSFTSMSLDTEGMFFNQYLDGFYPDRVYKIQLKLKYNDEQEQIFDDDFEFIVKRN